MLHFKDEFQTPGAKVLRFNIGAFGVNTYILIDKKTRQAAVVDPGGEVPELLRAIEDENAAVTHILFTHAHIDHMAGAYELKTAVARAKIAYHGLERDVVAALPDMCAMFDVPLQAMPALDLDLAATPEFLIGELRLRSLHTPGHTPGGVVFYLAEEKLAFTGDTLFRGSVGRTDFEGGSGLDLRKSLDFLLASLPDDVRLLPGHGKYSSMADERRSNFYLRVDRWR